MIIFDNIVFASQKSGGISLVWRNILEPFVNEKSECFFIDYPSANNNIFRKELNFDLKKIIIRNGNPYIMRIFPPRLKSTRENHLFFTSGYNIVNKPNVYNIIIVHDLIYEKFGKRKLSYYYNVLPKKRAIIKSNLIICVSENTRKDLFEYLPSLDKNKVVVIYNGVSDEFKPNIALTSKFDKLSKNEFVLFIGRRSTYKNFRLAVEGLCKSNLKKKLVITGNEPFSSDEIELLRDNIGDNYYYLFTALTTVELNSLYANAYALLYISSYEGFGIPVLEAQRSGCPVIGTSLSSLPEIGGDGYIKLESLNPESVANALISLLDENFATSLVTKGYKNSQRFSWKKTSDQYYSIIMHEYCKLTKMI
jgi:mannosyltransferase